jgi:hypothetical protein
LLLAQVVRSLLKPSAKVPTSQWDVLMNAVHDGDVRGVWLALSLQILQVAAVGWGASLAWGVASGGEGGVAAWAFAGVAAAAAVTELVKVSTGMMGGS